MLQLDEGVWTRLLRLFWQTTNELACEHVDSEAGVRVPLALAAILQTPDSEKRSGHARRAVTELKGYKYERTETLV